MMPSKLRKLVKCTCTVHDSDIVAIPAGFTDIGVDNAPSSANFACHHYFCIQFFDNEWGKPGICSRKQLNAASNSKTSQ